MSTPEEREQESRASDEDKFTEAEEAERAERAKIAEQLKEEGLGEPQGDGGESSP
jgi:hypothetical protein